MKFSRWFLRASVGPSLALMLAAALHGEPSGLGPALQKLVDERLVSGVVALVEHRGQTVSFQAVGQTDVTTGAPMRRDTLFSIASMTKPFNAVAILMLRDEGKLALDDELAHYLPEFANQWVVAEKTPAQVTLAKPRTPITLRHLLTHTSGLNTDLPNEGADLSQADKARFYATQPLTNEPGTHWQYSNVGINVLARVIEVVSGHRYEDFLAERIFEPLGMVDTTFWPTEAQAVRLAKTYAITGPERTFDERKISYLGLLSLTDRGRPPLPAGGLFSTAPDLQKFYEMVLAGGEWHGRRFLSTAAVTEMTRAQTGALKVNSVEGAAWGLGWTVVSAPQGETGMLAPGTFGHRGAYGTQVWLEPATGSIYLLLIQRAKAKANPDVPHAQRQFQEAASRLVKTLDRTGPAPAVNPP